MRHERPDSRHERPDLGPERVDFRPERADFKPESPPVFYRTSSHSGPLPKKGEKSMMSRAQLELYYKTRATPTVPNGNNHDDE